MLLTATSSVLSSNGCDSTPSGLRRVPLMKVPLEDFTSLIYICSGGEERAPKGQRRTPSLALGVERTFPPSSQTSACCLERTFESK